MNEEDTITNANVSQLFTADKRFLTERIGKVPLTLLSRIETGVRLVLSL